MTRGEIRLANDRGLIPRLSALEQAPVTAFWTRLGFTAVPGDASDFTFTRSSATLTYVPDSRLDIRTTYGVAFVTTDRIDDLHAEFAGTGIWLLDAPSTNDGDEGFDERLTTPAGIGRLGRPVDRDWGMREFRLFDPANNLIRFAQIVDR